MISRDEIAADQEEIFGEGPPCTITSPAGISRSFVTIHRDNHLQIDTGTGEAFTGRQVSISVRRASLNAVGFVPVAVADENAVPWTVTVADASGVDGTYKIVESNPSDGMGIATFMLEVYGV